MLAYATKAATAWLLGFAPFLEIYVAIPAAVGMGLDPVSAFFWPTFGNLTPLVAVPYCSRWLRRQPRVWGWINRMVDEKWEERCNRWGKPFLVVAVIWLGVWATAATAVTVKIRAAVVVFWSTLTVLVLAVITLLASLGVRDWLLGLA